MEKVKMYSEFEQFLTHSLDHYPAGIVKEAALYSLLAKGKRVRPRLLFAVLNAYHCDTKKGYECACAVEMMHTYSLIHDDLPSMDNDTLRRGNPTCHVKYGEANAILAGDALLTHSFTYASKASVNQAQNLQIVKELSQSGGLDGMIYGQELDVDNHLDEKTLDVFDLEKIHRYKTGKLIALPMVCGAILAGRNDDIENWREIGYLIGLMFQIQDDLFDITKTSEELGKNANSDLSNDKVTYVTLLGKDGCEKNIDNIYHTVLEMISKINVDKEPILEILDYLIKREK